MFPNFSPTYCALIAGILVMWELFSGLLLFGAWKENPKCVLAWLIIFGILFVLQVSICVCYFLKRYLSSVDLLVAASMALIFHCVLSYYVELKSKFKVGGASDVEVN